MDSDTPGRHRRPDPSRDPFTLRPQAYAAIAAVFLLGVLTSGSLAVIAPGVRAADAAVADPDILPPDRSIRPRVLVSAPPAPTITTAPPAPTPEVTTASSWSVLPLPNEGMVALVTRICGVDAAGTWRANALANGIAPPRYVVRLDMTLTIDCDAEVLPPDPSETQPEPSPTPTEAVVEVASPAPLGWVNPLPGACIGSGYGQRWGRMHYGLDLGASFGTPIVAAASGTVLVQTQIYYDASGNPQGAGNYTVIDHGGVWTVYMHQSSWAVTSGWVDAGDVIGYVGSTGGSSGPHLHFEVHTALWDTRIDPDGWMWDRGVGWGWC